jgi:hypothetical protein
MWIFNSCFELFYLLQWEWDGVKRLENLPVAEYVTLDNKIKCLSLAVFFFCNPTNKTGTGTAYTWKLLTANHLDESLWSTNQKYWAAVRSNLLHSLLEVHNCVAPVTSHGKLHEFGAEKPIPELNRHILTFSH